MIYAKDRDPEAETNRLGDTRESGWSKARSASRAR
jgi:hypothetical protein